MEGKLNYFNGACFDGVFDGSVFDWFKNGTFNFKHKNWKFKGEWINGNPNQGQLF